MDMRLSMGFYRVHHRKLLSIAGGEMIRLRALFLSSSERIPRIACYVLRILFSPQRLGFLNAWLWHDLKASTSFISQIIWHLLNRA